MGAPLVLSEKLMNLAAITSPADHIEFLPGSDGDNDQTTGFPGAWEHPDTRVTFFDRQCGKGLVIN